MSALYMTEAEAKACGFTHHGKMFSVPCWVTDNDTPMVAAKFAPLESWITLCTLAVQFMGILGADAAFPIRIGKPIEGVNE
ncbi:hypothetical protein HFK83_03050 [Ralstonia pseudosolanacearum]|uniref:hypothetical protein n=1 Tax=Ralstonia solanacearum species complex TaxID=3116862 RepID=UPI0011478372|nr:hypothetical protein [Ralstonia pseudosolanacearum]MCK4121349.1 hypothetical protein [Ralstonia pseudosolanacearum]